MNADDRLPFAMVPTEAFFDARLTLVQLRVLGALLSFRNRSTGLIFPSREAISERTGLPITRISTATSALVQLGWLKKEGRGRKACNYIVTIPKELTAALEKSMTSRVTVIESVTVTEPATVTESVTVTVTESVTDTVTESVTHNRQDNRQENRQRAACAQKPKTAIDLSVLPPDLSPHLWQEFVVHRKGIKAPITTQTAVDGIARELQKGREFGYSPDLMLSTVIEASWRGVDAVWIQKRIESRKLSSQPRGNPAAAIPPPSLARQTNLQELLL